MSNKIYLKMEAAQDAISSLDCSDLDGRYMKVSEAKHSKI